MKILITGAAGDIGEKLVSIFSKDPNVSLYTTARREIANANTAGHLVCDIRDEALEKWIETIRPDVVVHLASILNLPDNMSEQEAYEVDVLGTKRLLDACVAADVGKFVFTSSGAAYGYWHDNPEWLSEDMPVRGNDDYFYSRHKRLVELMLQVYRDQHPQLHQVVLRPCTVLGPNFDNPITRMFEGPIVKGIAGTASPFVIIWVDDLVAYLIEAITSDITGVFNVAGDGTLSLAEIAKRLNKPYLPIPAWLIKGVFAVLKPLGLSQYGPDQVKFIQFRPVLSNKKIKRAFTYQAQKTSAEAFEAFLQTSEKQYVKPR